MKAQAGDAARGAPVEITDLRKLYGSVVALERANLSIRAGEFVSLLGASGSGKSTLLKLIAGLDRATSGRILLDGIDATRTPPEKRGVGMVFQDYALFPTMSVAQNIAFPLRMRGIGAQETRARVQSVAAMLSIDRFLERRPSQLSGGQQQRVAIARAIVFEPKILLLDEPLSALDKNLREQTKGEIKALHERLGVTIIYVTHDQSEALAMSDRIAVLDHGHIVDLDTPTALYRTPRSSFLASFLGQANLLPVTILERFEHGCAVDSAWGRFEIPTDRLSPLLDQSVGGPAYAIVRPEHLTIAEGDPAPNAKRIATTATQALYNGSETIYRVTCQTSGLDLTLRENRPGRRLFRAGETMPVDVDLGFVVLTPRSEARP